MFGFYKSSPSPHAKKASRDLASHPYSPSTSDYAASIDSMQASIDGPPSPARIRNFTEQVKMNVPYVPTTVRTYTTSSTNSSLRSGNSGSSGEKLSRKSSQTSVSSRREGRPESVQIFGKLFVRGKKSRPHLDNSRSASSLSSHVEGEEHSSAKDRFNARIRRGTLGEIEENARPSISEPYNFQHVTHTRQDHLPNMERSSRMDLASNFTAMRESQIPAIGKLKGIKTTNLQSTHFENFSSEDVNEEQQRPMTSPQKHRTMERKSIIPQQRRLSHAKSHDSLRQTPPRPPRSPISNECPIMPPPRTSSRTVSVLLEDFATSSLSRPQSTFRAPKAFHLPNIPAQRIMERREWDESVPAANGQRSPEVSQWPLPTPPPLDLSTDHFPLTEVSEEEEGGERVQTSRQSIRHSKSVPEFRYTEDRPKTPNTGSTLKQDAAFESTIGVAVSPKRFSLVVAHESWEDDIDYCYEHEAEADCEYDWDRCSLEESRDTTASSSICPSMSSSQQLPPQQLALPEKQSQFRPSLLVPSALDIPELSPISAISRSTATSPNPQTPLHPTRPAHLRSSSHASSFKESHGFTLSPSFLIPKDFSQHMDDETHYLLTNDTTTIVPPYDEYSHPSPVDARSSTTSSFRSSGQSMALSRISGSTTSTKSTAQSSTRSVYDSSDFNAIGLSHNSASSLPELVFASNASDPVHQNLGLRPTSKHQSYYQRALQFETPQTQHSQYLASAQSFDNLSLAHGSTTVLSSVSKIGGLSPSASFSALELVQSCPMPPMPQTMHARKASAPLLSRKMSAGAGLSTKGRARASSAVGQQKGRGGYNLFPQI